jgi:hypothetical protein
MAAPVAAKVTLPTDAGNTGSKVRTQTRVVGADTVHEHFFIPISNRSKLGNFKVALVPPVAVPAAVHNGTTTGFLWLFNPVGSAVKMAIKRCTITDQFTALAADLLAGELRVNLFTFTGTASGASLTPGKHDSTDAAAVGNARTASTGLTCTLGACVLSRMYQTMDLVTGGGGHWSPYTTEWNPGTEDEEIILRPGEGLVFWHATAVTAGNRRLTVNSAWEEIE